MAVISYKCPNCDGELIFDPSTQKYKCEYCFSLFSQQELDSMQPAQAEEKEEREEPRREYEQEENAGAVIYNCPSCGAQIVTEETTAATFCYYCHNPVVLSGKLSGEFLPDKIIPFSVTREEAEKRFMEYICEKKFVPKAFFSKKQIESISGIYFPHWHYGVQIHGKVQADAQKIRTWTSGDTEYTETKYYQVYREGDITLDHMTEDALRKANKRLVDGVKSYDYKGMKDFKMSYLSGFMAERRDIEYKELEGQMQGKMQNYAKDLVKGSMYYTHISVKNSDFRFLKEDWSYVLLPVWTLTYKAKNGKIYYYSMNGQTGAVFGDLPVDYKKLLLHCFLIFLILFGLMLIGGYFLW